MASTFSCPGCGAEYDTDQVESGTTFTCGECEATVTAPTAAPLRTAPVGGARARPGRPGPTSSPRAKTGSPAHHRPAAKSKAPLFAGIGVGAVAVMVAVVMFAKGGSGGGGPSGSTPEAPSAAAMAEEAIKGIAGKFDATTAQGSWDAALAIRDQAAGWRKENKNPSAIALLDREVIRLKGDILKLDPHFAPLRTERNERRYQDELAEFIDASWLPEADRIEARKMHDRLQRAGKADHGWAPADRFAGLEPLMQGLASKKTSQTDMESSPWFEKTKALATETAADLDQRFSDLPKDQWRGVDVARVKPFVVFVQRDPSWDPVMVAKSRGDELKALEAILLHEYGEALGLKPIEEPVPVLMFRNYDMYKKYSGNMLAYAHFEPMTGRLAVHDSCDHTTILHEGTHQLMWAWTDRKGEMAANPALRSYWFQEGIAEWYGGAHRDSKPGGGYQYLIGLLHEGRIDSIRQSQGEGRSKLLFNLRELLNLRYADRPRVEKTFRVGQMYAQAWFLIYFLNHFEVDAEGYVVLGKPGRYAANWTKYVKAELTGETGLDSFMKIMQLDDAALDRMEEEYWRYFAWIRKKINYGHVKDKQIIPWNEFVNKKGEKTGEKSDDLLPQYDPTDVPPRDRK